MIGIATVAGVCFNSGNPMAGIVALTCSIIFGIALLEKTESSKSLKGGEKIESKNESVKTRTF